jgi:large subunit ribosomal protein L23
MTNQRYYDVIRSVHISEKSTFLNEINKYVFLVLSDATKSDVKAAIEFLYNVKITSLNVLNVKGKKKRFKGVTGMRSDYRKAIVTLEKDSSIDLSSYN